MTTMDEFREIRGDGTVIVSIKEEHIDKVFEAIGDEIPDKMVDLTWGGFALLWEDVYLNLATWYLNIIDLLESIEEEYGDLHFSIEVARQHSGDGFGVDFNFHGSFGGFEPVIKYNMYGKEVDPDLFVKEE